ncbi:uncharacterized protein NPIL_30471 [Nephila pilipes]|uniref:Uncharacterized protein n=1 Tax=Nephila pilipes TaxID=299642 RepID=A0A8X6NPH5_NEPPI|nr:uncharacterized protein NPIL_30471 [Nephila pilipes]
MSHMFILLFSLLLGILPVCLSDGDYLEACAEQEICHTPNGIVRAVQCVNMLSKKDMDIIYDIFPLRYPEAKDLTDVANTGCKNIKELAESIAFYFEEKDKMNVIYTAEENVKIMQSRSCLSLMITECQLKKALGVFKFGR